MGLYQLARTEMQQLLDTYVYERRGWSGWEEMHVAGQIEAVVL